MSDLKHYYENTSGHGVLATADEKGQPNVAIFARPHVIEENLVGFIMPDRKTHQNLISNPAASYLFIENTEETGGYRGHRLILRKVAEEMDSERVQSLRRRTYDDDRQGSYLVSFKVESILPLIGE